ncbi:MAG: CCA tRNA nucleotidyltransferase [Nitrospirae bacterium]|nr:CCA tRNA nucleotidyltransferase [Nitrospirota bacterium]
MSNDKNANNQATALDKKGPLFDRAVSLIEKLRKAGFQAYLAGGAVRDQMRGVVPKDFDIVTSAKPNELLSLFPQAIPVGAAFGVVLVPFGKDEEGGVKEKIEIATFRSDGVYLDGRHPQTVTFSDEKEDAFRRDFTINGMFFDPIENRVIDYVGGREDLEKKILRTIGDPEQRFKEDYLRLLRAVRFSAQFSFQIEQKTYETIQKMGGLIQKVSAERIRDELEKILIGDDPVRGLTLLDETGMMKVIFPEISQLKEIQKEGRDESVFNHTLKLFKFISIRSFELAMAILFHELEGKKAAAVCRRLKLSNDQTEKVATLVRDHPVFQEIPAMNQARFKRFLRLPCFEELLELYRADSLALGRKLDLWDLCVKKLKEFSQDDLFPLPVISGNVLIEMGYFPGPLFKRILHDLEDNQLEGKIKTREEASAWILKTYPLTDQDTK